jgi:hypothetical protein
MKKTNPKDSPDSIFPLEHSSPPSSTRNPDSEFHNLSQEKRLKLVIQLKQVLFDSTELESGNDPKSVIPIGLESDCFVIGGAQSHIVSLRPHLRFFLKKLRPLYEMSAFWDGGTEFAKFVLAKIDSGNEFFGERVVNERRSDDFTVVVDLKGDGWRNSDGIQPAGYIEIAPYYSFSNRDHPQFFRFLPAFSEVLRAKRPDNILPGVAGLLEQIHGRFYSQNGGMLLDAVEFSLTQVLSSCRICTGGLVKGEAISSEFMAYLARFGAQCYEFYDPCCTHVLAWSPDDHRIQEARLYKGVYVVTFGWVIDSCLCYRRMDEADYKITGIESPTRGRLTIEPPLPDRDLSSCESMFQSTASEEDTDSTDYEEEPDTDFAPEPFTIQTE